MGVFSQNRQNAKGEIMKKILQDLWLLFLTLILLACFGAYFLYNFQHAIGSNL
jgi:hypothetical protein